MDPVFITKEGPEELPTFSSRVRISPEERIKGTEGNFNAAAFQLLCQVLDEHHSLLEGLGLVGKV